MFQNSEPERPRLKAKVFGGKGLCAQNSRNSPKPYLFTGIIPQITGPSLDLLNPEMNLKYSG